MLEQCICILRTVLRILQNTVLEILQFAGFGILFLLSTFWVFKNPRYLLFVPLILVLLGQLGRLPIPLSNIGILSSDLLMPYIVALWFFKKLVWDRQLPQSLFGKQIWIFILILVLSLILNLSTLPGSEILISSFYLIRLLSYILFFFICKEALQTEGDIKKFLHYFMLTIIGLSLLGILQFIFISDFRFMAAAQGWDPHIGRLLSTWFDPNYLAGFFALVIGLYLSTWYMEKQKLQHLRVVVMLLIVGVCFVLTYSRSGIVALGVIIGIIGIIKIRSILLIGLIASFLAVSLSDRVAERVLGLVDGGISLITGSIDHDLDVTSQKRVESWMENLSLVQDHYIYGMGYNTLEFRKLDKGIIASGDVHSASGSDSSLLNILLTTGLVGVFSYLFLYWSFCREAFLLYISKNTSLFQKGFGLGLFAGLLGIMVHSFFVNSLLFPLFLMVLVPLWAALDTLASIRRATSV